MDPNSFCPPQLTALKDNGTREVVNSKSFSFKRESVAIWLAQLLDGIGAPELSTDDWIRLSGKLERLMKESPNLAAEEPRSRQERTVAVGFQGTSDWLALVYAQSIGSRVSIISSSQSCIRTSLKQLSSENPGSHLFFFVPARQFNITWSREAVNTFTQLGVPCGFLPLDSDPVNAIYQILRLVWLRSRDPHYPHRLLSYASYLDNNSSEECYGANRENEFIRHVSEGSFATVLSAHGNGADINLGTKILCVQSDHLAPEAGCEHEVFLPCQAGGPCLRDSIAMESEFVGADAFRTAAMVLLTCNGIVPSEGIIDLRFSFTEALLRGDHVRTVVSTCRYVMESPSILVEAIRLLRCGASTGELALYLNRRMDSDSPAYCCLGDPGVVLPKSFSGHSSCQPQISGPRIVGFPIRSRVVKEVTAYLIAGDILSTWMSAMEPEEAHMLQSTYDNLRLMTALLFRDSIHASRRIRENIDQRIAVSLATVLSAMPDSLSCEFVPIPFDRNEGDGPTCWMCGKLTRSVVCKSLRYPTAIRRRLVCDVHGLLSDLPLPLGCKPNAIRWSGDVDTSLFFDTGKCGTIAIGYRRSSDERSVVFTIPMSNIGYSRLRLSEHTPTSRKANSAFHCIFVQHGQIFYYRIFEDPSTHAHE